MLVVNHYHYIGPTFETIKSLALNLVFTFQVREMHKLEVRSVSCQHSAGGGEREDNNVPEEDCTSVSAMEYNHVTTRLDVSSFLSDVATSVSSASCLDLTSDDTDFTVDSSSEDTDDLDYHLGIREGRGRARNQGLRGSFRNFVEDIVLTFQDMFRSPNRSIMALIWCGYTFSIMLIANGFFPYMILYSLLFLLIMYAETIQERRN